LGGRRQRSWLGGGRGKGNEEFISGRSPVVSGGGKGKGNGSEKRRTLEKQKTRPSRGKKEGLMHFSRWADLGKIGGRGGVLGKQNQQNKKLALS